VPSTKPHRAIGCGGVLFVLTMLILMIYVAVMVTK
jgi:hypothetical protein